MRSMIKHPSDWLPMAMSLAALTILLGYVAIFGVTHDVDEGTAAHLFQLLMGGQAFVVAFFVIKWLPRQPKQAIQILVLQIGAAMLPMAVLFWFEHS